MKPTRVDYLQSSIIMGVILGLVVFRQYGVAVIAFSAWVIAFGFRRR